MVIKRLTNLFLLRGRLFNLRLWFWEVFLSFLWWLLCCVMVDIPIFSSFFFSPIFILFFSIHFGWDLCGKRKQKNDWWFNRELKDDRIVGLKLWIKLKINFALSRVINFLMSLNNTNSLSNSNVIGKSSGKRISIDWTPYSLKYCHNICVRTVKRVDFNILEVKGLIPLKGPMVLRLPKIFSSPPPPHKIPVIWLHNAWLKHWSLYPLILWHGMRDS